MKPTTEILLSAAFVLTPREHWFGKDRPREPDTWCALLAIDEAHTKLYPRLLHNEAFVRLKDVIGAGTISSWNDSHTHAEVLAALYRAAELSEAS